MLLSIFLYCLPAGIKVMNMFLKNSSLQVGEVGRDGRLDSAVQIKTKSETCKISCMKRVASPGSMHDTGCLGLVHWDDPEGGYGEGGGRRV